MQSNIYEVMSFAMLVIAFLAWCVVAVCVVYRRYEERRRRRKEVEADKLTGSDQHWRGMKWAGKSESGEQAKES